jgi:hypothetical protein
MHSDSTNRLIVEAGSRRAGCFVSLTPYGRDVREMGKDRRSRDPARNLAAIR